jgi:hypothetical protein
MKSLVPGRFRRLPAGADAQLDAGHRRPAARPEGNRKVGGIEVKIIRGHFTECHFTEFNFIKYLNIAQQVIINFAFLATKFFL